MKKITHAVLNFFKRDKGKEEKLSNLGTISKWMQDLPAGDIFTSQEHVVQSLIQFNHAGLPMTRERLQVLMHLDEQSRDMQSALHAQYLRNPRMSKLIESRLWSTIYAYHWEVTRAYHAFIMDFVANPGANKLQSHLPQITARAIRGFADIFKWRYFLYETIDEKMWLRMHNLYRIAEFEGLHTAQFKLYASDLKTSSVMEEYLQALLLSPLGTGNLVPKQIDMIDLWLDNWSGYSQLDTAFDSSRHHFYVDFTKGYGLKRFRPNMVVDANFRYLDLAKLHDHIWQIEHALKSGALHAALGLGEEFRLPSGYDLLKQVSNEWSEQNERERRINDRLSLNGYCEVVRDLPPICKFIESELETSLNPTPGQQLSPEDILDIKTYGFVTERSRHSPTHQTKRKHSHKVERWPVIDRSDTGIGLKLKDEECEWVKVGKLLAIRANSTESWTIGTVRRMTRLEDNMRKIGVQTITTEPVLVYLESREISAGLSYTVEHSHLDEHPSVQALTFTHPKDGKLLILQSALYSHGRQYNLRNHTGLNMIRLESVRDKGDGWLICSYKNTA